MSEINPNRFSDSAGVPWDGRAFEENVFASDDGSAPEEFISAINDFRSGIIGAEKVFQVISKSRLLIPLLASLGASEIGTHGKLVDKSAELSIVTVKAPDEQNALVAFSSVSAMEIWNSNARPVPTDAIRLALAAASEMVTRVVIDPGSDTEFVLTRPAIAKLAQQLPWLPPELTESVRKVVAESIDGEAFVLGFELASGDPSRRLYGAELQIRLLVKSGASAEEVKEMIDRVSRVWSQSAAFAESVDSVSVKLIAS